MNPAKSERRLMTFAQAQKRLGMKGPRGLRLKRLTLRREKETGKRIIVRGGTIKQPTYRVTMSALRKHLPELFDSQVTTLRRDMKRQLEAIDEVIASRLSAHMAEYVEPRLDELWERDEIVAKEVRALSDRVTALARVKCT